MIAGRHILRMSALCAGVLAVLAAPSTAQSIGVRDLRGVAARVFLQGRGCAADVRSRSRRAGDRHRAASGGSRHSRRASGSLNSPGRPPSRLSPDAAV